MDATDTLISYYIGFGLMCFALVVYIFRGDI